MRVCNHLVLRLTEEPAPCRNTATAWVEHISEPGAAPGYRAVCTNHLNVYQQHYYQAIHPKWRPFTVAEMESPPWKQEEPTP